MTGQIHRRLSIAGLAAVGLAACATAPDVPELDATEAIDPERQPADQATREAADRAPPLERANFWASEHAKDPSDPEVTLRFGEALRTIGSHERVVDVTTQTLVIHPNHNALHLLRGRAQMALGQFEYAANAFTRAAASDPMNADAYANQALAYDRLGQHRRAQAAYGRALSIDANRPATRANLGLSLALSGDLDGAEVQLRQAAEMPGATSTIRQNLALVLGLKGDFEAMEVAAQDAPDAVVDANVEALKSFRRLAQAGNAATDTADVVDEDPGLSLRGALPDAN